MLKTQKFEIYRKKQIKEKKLKFQNTGMTRIKEKNTQQKVS